MIFFNQLQGKLILESKYAAFGTVCRPTRQHRAVVMISCKRQNIKLVSVFEFTQREHGGRGRAAWTEAESTVAEKKK